MKRISKMKAIALLAALLATLGGLAQPRVGMRAGAIWSSGNQSVAGDLVSYGSTEFSFSGGFFADFELDRKLLLSIGLGYEERQLRYDLQVPTGRTSFGLVFFTPTLIMDQFHYLTIPAFIEYSPIDRIGFSTGPQLSVLLDAESEIGIQKTNTTALFNDIDLSWGIGIEFQGNRSMLGIRYQYGLVDLNEPPVEGDQYSVNTLHIYLAGYFN